MKGFIKNFVSIALFAIFAPTTIASPYIIQDDRVRSLDITPVLGRGYSIMTNSYQSTCLMVNDTTTPSYNYDCKWCLLDRIKDVYFHWRIFIWSYPNPSLNFFYKFGTQIPSATLLGRRIWKGTWTVTWDIPSAIGGWEQMWEGSPVEHLKLKRKLDTSWQLCALSATMQVLEKKYRPW